ncbi:Na+/H+ antiporter NhaA [Leeuwenhoekiella marinoflava]|uniref:Na+/H+ antiporter NhaA n=1 Tax=Leeuwenhoekiella marinoflava TaxID=988 RepID=UPI0030028281
MAVKYNPIKHFIKTSSYGSFILIGCTVLALVWANSPWSESYFKLFQENFTIGFTESNFAISKALYLWINDGLMTIFFFYVGLEIKREVLAGELSTLNKAAMPIFAAIGGILVPITLFLILNNQDSTLRGWGIPMATDIAFSLGILSLLGKRVPLSLKIFLTAFAIIDDIGAILIIAFFYAENLQLNYLIIGCGIIGIFAILSRIGFYSKYLLLTGSVVVWILFLKSGIHPTIAGVLMALVIPTIRMTEPEKFISKTKKATEVFKESEVKNALALSPEQTSAVKDTDKLTKKIQSPLERLEHALSGWVSVVIMPIFALANAGIKIDLNALTHQALISNIAISMVVGKVVGIFTFSYLSCKLGLAILPKGVDLKQLLGISFLGAIGFTMSLFIGELAFRENSLLVPSKIGILLGSLIAGIIGYFLLKHFLNPNNKSVVNKSN